jgi:uncharacterized membrane protein YhaH (DUF805 family)
MPANFAAFSPPSDPGSRRWRRPLTIVVALLIAAYGVLLATHVGAWPGGSDSSGYLNHARLLREGKTHEPLRTLAGLPAKDLPDFAYVPLGFVSRDGREATPTYPVGLPLLIGALSSITGWTLAPHVALWLHTMAGVALMFALAREFGLSRGLAAAGAVILASCPLYLLMGLQAMSDVPALVWCLASVWCAWRCRERPLWALAAGACVGLAVLVRPSNLLILLSIALSLGQRPRAWGWLILGGLPAAAFFAAYNHALYGNAFTTGYGSVGAIFSPEYLRPSLGNYLRWLPVLLTPVVILALALPWAATRETRLRALVCGAWAVPFLIFYAFYYHTHEVWWYLRFLLPAFPALILAMLLVLQRAAGRVPLGTRPLVAVSGIVAAALWGSYWTQDRWALDGVRGEKVYPDTARWAQQYLPPNAVILAMQMTGALAYSTDFTVVRYQALSPAQLATVERVCAEQKRPIYALLFPEERDPVFTAMPGGWNQIAAVSQVTVWERTRSAVPPAAPWHVVASTSGEDCEITARTVGDRWFDGERSHRHTWTWSGGPGAIELETYPRRESTVQFKFSLRSTVSRVVTVTKDGTEIFRGEVGTDRLPVTLNVHLTAGRSRLDFASPTPGVRENDSAGARTLAFAVYDPQLETPAAKR